ncbi:hypothetical protein J4421_00685 [Candidatus Woesearchaeota archaeon]|nr:hypothetical protein [Candidatus Woesearchaeota archaeon]
MSPDEIINIREQLFQLERRIKPLEWDSSRNQINEFKKLELGKLQAEHLSLSKKLQELQEERKKGEQKE